MIPVRKIRVLIVDDSILFRKAMEQNLGKDPHIEIVGTAADPYEAVQKMESLKPDVITMDVEMPKLNGIDFLKKILPNHPTPVVVVSSLSINTLDALAVGAVDFVRKPEVKFPQDLTGFFRELAIKIKIASTARVEKSTAKVSAPPLTRLNAKGGENTVIAIGASTGGTEAILAVVRDLPATTPGILVVQHMPPVFTNMYAQRLDKICHMGVKEAANGDRVERGRILIAAGEHHLRLVRDSRGYFVKSEKGEKVSGHCPSVDVLFDSVAAVAGKNALGVILTGMGADGAKGLLKMRQAGAYTIGQDKESCVVYGMPMVAFHNGGVQKQLPLDRIGNDIISFLNRSGA